jgi:hypothetical protein
MTSAEAAAAVPLKDLLGFVMDCGKFIVTLWSSYIVLATAMIGWLVSLRGQGKALDRGTQWVLVLAFVLVTAVAAAVIWQNSVNLVLLMQVADATAAAIMRVEGAKAPGLAESYGALFDVARNKLLLE